MQFELEDYATIIDKETNEIIASGKIIGIKDRYIEQYRKYFFFKGYKEIGSFCISFDNKYFFNTKSDRFIFLKKSDKSVDFDTKLLTVYSNQKYSGIITNADIYIENTINELDEEVVRVVKLLNKVPGIKTCGSCSGHGLEKLWVSMTFFDVQSIRLIAKIIYEKFDEKFVLSTKKHRSQITKNCVELSLISKNKGKKAYKDIDEFCDVLEVIIHTLYNEI